MNRATLEKVPGEVAAMFDAVAANYDLTNSVLTAGMVKVWREASRLAVNPRPGFKILDVAAGTGSSAASYAKFGAEVTALDFSEGMIAQGKKMFPELEFIVGDAMDLPFEPDTFDVTTISYGLRNVNDPQVALREMLRVTKPGGKLVVTEFSHPVNKFFGRAYNTYLTQVLPRLAGVVATDVESYDYLVESIKAWPDQEEFGAQIYRAGWKKVEYRNLANGAVAIHRALKPAQ